MRQLLSAIYITGGLTLIAQSVAAQSVLHEWPVTETRDAGTVLTAQGMASGKGLTATIASPISLLGSDAKTLFDAEIKRQMKDADVIKRDEQLAISNATSFMLVTMIGYESGWLGDKRIAMFAASGKVDQGSITVVRADGPDDREMMTHYSGDILALARHPEAAIAGALTIDPHPSAAKATVPEKSAKETVKAAPSVAPTAPNGWGRKVYTDGANYWPTTGLLPRGGKTGYLAILIYNPLPLNGKSVKDALADFTIEQESHFNVQRTETAITDGPHRAWDYLRSKTKKGVYLNVSFLAIRTDEDSVRIVREILTDDDHTERASYVRDIERLYRHIENETEPAFRAETVAAATMSLMTEQLQTETRTQRRERQKMVKAAARTEHLRKVSSEPGRGIPLSDVSGVFLRSDFLQRAYRGQDADPSVYVLLKDGTAYVNPTRPPSDIDIAGSRRFEASQWKQWRRTEGGYQVRDDASAPWKSLKGQLAKPAPSTTFGFKGKHIAAWGDALMGTAGHRTGSIKLTKGGRYETSSFALAGGSGITGLPAATVSSSTGRNGRQSTTSSNVAPALLNNIKRDPNGTDFTGQYALRGYTAEFLSDSGKLSRTLFLMNSEGGVYVGGRYYSVPKK